MVFKKSLHPCAMDKSNLSIERVNLTEGINKVQMVFKKSLHPCAMDKSSLSIGRVNLTEGIVVICRQ